jgi:UV excision repair protein RAD23
LVVQLESLGFGKGDSEDALRASKYDVELAAQYLCDGVPYPLSIFSLDGLDLPALKAQVSRYLEDLKSGKCTWTALIDSLRKDYPGMAAAGQAHPVFWLRALGFEEEAAQFRTLQKAPRTLFEELQVGFTPEEMEAIKRISSRGYDTMVVIQVYCACDKDEEVTLNCLKMMAR